MTDRTDPLETAFILLAERHAAEVIATRAARAAAGQTPKADLLPRWTRDEVFAAVEAAETVAAGARVLDAVNTNECNGYRDPATERRDARNAFRALVKIEAALADYGVGFQRGGDPRGSAIKLMTPHTKRYNTWGGAESGWAV